MGDQARAGNPLRCVIKNLESVSGAVGGTRTRTSVTSQRPQRCASTNSATTACHRLGVALHIEGF